MKPTKMELHLEGGSGSVTGSCSRLVYSCEDEKYQILVDCGLLQESEDVEIKIPEWSFNAAEISCVLLTHAHIDHCGAIPLLYKQGFTGKVYATEATMELSKIMLSDVASKREDLFQKEDIDKIHWQCIDDISSVWEHGKFFRILPNIRACYIRSSHILGAVSFYVQWFKNVYEENEKKENGANDYENYKTILFSGDVGRAFKDINEETTFLKPNYYPFSTANTKNEIFVLESTYGNRLHVENSDYRSKLAFLERTLRVALQGNGYVVIPAFALDRTQTVLGDLFEVLKSKPLIPKEEKTASEKSNKKNSKNSNTEKLINIYSVSPLGNMISKVYARNLGVNSKFMKQNGKISFRYLNEKPYIPDNYIDELNQNTDETVSDSDVTEKISCLISRNDEKKNYANDFSFMNENMFEQRKVGGQQKSVPKSASTLMSPRSIIVGASGMCDKGFIKDAIEKALPDENATIILTGYTPKDSAGEIIKRFANGTENSGFTKRELFNKSVPSMNVRLHEIKARIVDMSDFYSAHADQGELLTYVFDNPSKPRESPVHVILNHGTVRSGLPLARKIDDFNQKLQGGNSFQKTIISSEFCKVFDISGDEIIPLSTEEEKSEHEKLLEKFIHDSQESVVEKISAPKNMVQTVKKEEPQIREMSENEKMIRNDILKSSSLCISGIDVTDLTVATILEILKDINFDSMSDEDKNKRKKGFCNWRGTISNQWPKYFQFSQAFICLSGMQESSELFTKETFEKIKNVCDGLQGYNFAEKVTDAESEINRLSGILEKRNDDELLKNMPYTRSIPKGIHRLCLWCGRALYTDSN